MGSSAALALLRIANRAVARARRDAQARGRGNRNRRRVESVHSVQRRRVAPDRGISEERILVGVEGAGALRRRVAA